MSERTGKYHYCAQVHGAVAFEVMQGTKRDYARCPVKKCGSLVTFPRGTAPPLTREQAFAAASRSLPMTLEEGLRRVPDAVVLPLPTGDELLRLDETADLILEEVEAEEQADLDSIDGDWPPSTTTEGNP